MKHLASVIIIAIWGKITLSDLDLYFKIWASGIVILYYLIKGAYQLRKWYLMEKKK